MIQVSLKVIGFLSVLFVVVMMGGLLTWIIFLPLITKILRLRLTASHSYT